MENDAQLAGLSEYPRWASLREQARHRQLAMLKRLETVPVLHRPEQPARTLALGQGQP